MTRTTKTLPPPGRAKARRHAPSRLPGHWLLQDAKARFSEVFRLARENGPQRVTKHGREAGVVVSAEEFARMRGAGARKGSLVDFFAASPLRDSGIDLRRARDFGREVDL